MTRISAFERDKRKAAEIRYSLGDSSTVAANGGGDGATFKVDETTGSICLVKALDYERNQLYNLSIVATDKGKPLLSSTTYLLVEVGNVNENYHAQKFADFYATASVKENRPVGVVVTKMAATDEDDPSLQLIYQIIGGSGLGRFTINSSGVILTRCSSDRHCQRPNSCPADLPSGERQQNAGHHRSVALPGGRLREPDHWQCHRAADCSQSGYFGSQISC